MAMEPAAPEGSGGGPGKIIAAVQAGLDQLSQALSQAEGSDPEAVQMISDASQMFRAGIEKLLSQGAPQQPAAQGVAPMEQGGAKGAVPMM
jgi:hypothetical protein